MNDPIMSATNESAHKNSTFANNMQIWRIGITLGGPIPSKCSCLHEFLAHLEANR